MLPAPVDLLNDLFSALVLTLMVVSWSAGSLVSAFASSIPEHHLEASAAPAETVGPDAALGQGQLDAAAAAAKSDWQAVRPSADLGGLTFSIADLGGLQLGDAAGSAITVDVDAAGWGWSQMDLGTVVRHEIGHALGLPHGSGLMSPALSPGESHGVGSEYAEPTPEPEPTTPAAQTATATDPGPDAGQDAGQTTGPAATEAGTGTSGPTDATTGSGSTAQPGSGTNGADQPTSQNADRNAAVAGVQGPVPDASANPGPANQVDTSVTSSVASSLAELQSLTSALPMSVPTALSSTGDVEGTTGDDVFTILVNGGGSYGVSIGGTVFNVSGTDTLKIDGLGGIDTIVAPNVAGLWKITKINEGSYQVTGGPTFEFKHVENITGAPTAPETYRFSNHAGLTGLVDDGTGTLTVSIGDFVRVSGDYDFAREAKNLMVVGGGTPGAKDTNVLTLGGTSGSGFVGITVDLIDSQLGFVGALTSFALAVVTATDESQAWHVFDGTIAAPHLGDVLGLDLDLHLTSLQIAMNGTSENGSWLNLSGAPISVTTGPSTTKALAFAGSQVSASAPVSLDLGGVLHLNGTLTLTKGGVGSVDLNTGLDETSGVLSQIKNLEVATSDPTNGTDVRRSADYSKLWNLQVSTLQFAFTGANAFIGSGFSWGDTNADEVMQQSELGAGALGLFAGGINLTFLMLTPLGGMPISKRFLGLKGYVAEVGLTGFDDYFVLTAKNVEFEANLGTTLESEPGATSTAVVDWVSSFPDPNPSDNPTDGSDNPTPPGYHVFIGGTSPPAIYLDSTDSVIGVSADVVVLSISSFVHISGGFSFTTGGHAAVDVHTDGLSSTDQGNLAGAVPGDPVEEDTDDGSLASNDDGSIIYNVPVTTFLLGISNAAVFVGYNAGGFDLGPDDVFQQDDLDDDAVGLLATGINLGLVIATPDGDPVPGWRLPAFLSLKATIAHLLPVGLPDEFVLAFQGITLSLNRAAALRKGPLAGLPVLKSRAWVDWEASFPGDDPGLEVPTGDDETPVLIDFDDPVLGISAERVTLAISDFVYITGGFSLQLGGLEKVDVDARGLNAALATAIRGSTAASASDPGTLSTTTDGSTIWNVPVTTTLFGISNASIFVGYNPNAEGTDGTSFNTGDDAILDDGDLHGDAVGFLANNIDIGLVFASVDKSAGGWTVNMPRFWALQADIALLTPVGLPSEFVLRFEKVRLSLNRGGQYGVTVGSSLWVNWTASFPDPDGADDPATDDEIENPVPAGIEVPTGAEDEPVYIDFEDPIFGISAHNVKLAISDFVFISGGFAFEVGGREKVDVDTAGLGVGGSALAGLVNGGPTASETDPTNGSTKATSNASTIWNLPVVTRLLGISHASVFVGYNPNATGTTGTSFDTGDDLVLDEGDLSNDAIGFLASDINIGLVFANVDKDPAKTWMNQLPNFWALKATVNLLAPIGLPSEFQLKLEGVQLTLNRGGAVNAAPQTEAWVNWTKSYRDPDGADDPDTTPVVEGPVPAGFAVPTGLDNDPVYIDFDDPIFGISATKVTLAISDFVYLTGGFAFQQGGRERVDISTAGLTPGSASAYAASIGISAEDPTNGTVKATATGSDLWNVPVVTTLIGISNASVFIGYNPNAEGTDGTSFNPGTDGILDDTDLSDDAIGLLANGITVGIVLAKVEPIASATWDDSLPTFFAVRATIALLTPVGLPDDLVFRFEGVGLSLNRGGAISGVADNAWIDWRHSLPAATGDPAGLQIPTGLGNAPVTIDFDDPIIGVEGQKIVISIFDFVHVSGGFAFEKGGMETVTVNTGLVLTGPDAGTCAQLAAAAAAATLEGTELSSDCRTLTGVEVETMKIGVYNASVFIGYNPGGFDMGTDQVLQETELGDGAIGFLAGGLNLGFVMASFVRGLFTRTMGEQVPTFYAIRGHIDELMLVGVPDITLKALDGDVSVNVGSKWSTATSPGGPSIDWAASFPDPDGDDDSATEAVENPTPAGIEVPTGGDNPSVYIDYDGYLIGGGVNKFFLQISSFVYLSGGFYFEYGAVRDMPLTDGIVDTSLIQAAAEAAHLGVITAYVGLASKELRFMTIGAQDVHAFVGLNGPDWVDADGDGEIDRDSTGQIIDAEVNHDAVGLVLDDVDFALALMTPLNPVDPTRYIALKASAAKVALVGVDGLVATAKNLIVQLNISTPTLYGLPLLPVVDFAQWNTDNPEDQFAVTVAAPETFGGDPVVVPFTFDTALIRASGQFNLNVFGVLALSGSLAFNLGKAVDATLSDSGHTVVTNVVTMTIGGSNLLGFVGYAPNNGSAWELNPDGSVHWVDADGDDCTPSLTVDCEIVQNPNAIGLLINDLDFGIFVGVKTPSATDVTAGVFVATNIVVDSFGLIGVPGITALGTLAIMLNLGLALGQNSAAGGIDFKRTFTYDPDGEQEASEGADGSTSLCTEERPSTDADPNCDDLPGLALDSGDSANPILIDFDTTFISVSLAGVLNIVDFVQALGVFYLEADDQGLKLLADAQLLVGPDKIANPIAGNVSGNHGTGVSPILEIGALGVLIINGQGIAADLDVDFSLNVQGISVNASARILFNSTGVLQQVEIPGRLYDFLADQAAASSLAEDLLDRLSPCTPQPEGAATTVYCYKIGGTAPDLGNSTTVFNLLHNASGTITTSGSPGAYVVVLIDGRFDFLGFAEASGLAGVRISGDVFQLVFNLHFSIGIDGAGLDFDSSGFVEINPDGLILDIAVSLDLDVTSLFHLDVSGSLYVKTYGPDKRFHLTLNGRLAVLGIFTVNGHLEVTVANNAWDVTVSASGRFGPVNITGTGSIHSDGTFDLRFSAGFQIGPDVVHIGASIGLHIYMLNVRADRATLCNADDTSIHDCGVANGGSLNFGFELSGRGEACAFGICLGVDISVTVGGSLSGNPAVASFLDVKVRGCVDLLFGDVCATIKVATIRLPGSIFPENDPKLAELQGGILLLNVGSRGSLRVVSPSATAEDYQIVDLGTATNGTRTIQVTAFGRSKVYKGVTAIAGDFGEGDDSFTLVNGSVPVTISGGGDSDTLITNGTGSVTFNGNGGADMLVGGSGADILNGGSGNDYLEGRGGVDQLDGGADDDIFVAQIADVFGESPQAGEGVDTYEIIGTTGADGFGVSVVGNALSMTYAGPAGTGAVNLTAFEKVVLQANQGGDTVTVSGNLGAADLRELTLGLTELTSGNEADTIVLNLTVGDDVAGLTGGTAAQVFSLARVAGGDTLEYPTPPGGAVPLTTVSWQGGSSLLRLVGSGAGDTDLFTLNGLAGADVFNLRGLSANTVVDAGDGNDLIAIGSLANGLNNAGGVVDGVDGALTVRGGSGTDTVTVDDSGDGSGDTDGHLTGTLLSGLGLPSTGLVYSQLEVLTTTLGTGADTFNVDSTSSGTATTVNGNLGNDTINVNDDNGQTTVHGNGGDDTVNVATTHGATTVHGDADNDTVNVTDSFGSLTVNGDDGTDTVTVTDTHATTTVNGGTGADTITLVDAHGVTAINGGDDADTITIRDTHAALTVHGDNGADIIRILALHAPTEAYGDLGNDSFLVGSAAPSLGGTLELIAAYLKLSGGAGTDAVRLDDTGDGTGDIGYVADGRVAGLGMTIDGSHIAAKPAWSVTVANAGDGTFQLTFGDATTGAIAFDAKAKDVQAAINAALDASAVTVTRSPVTRDHGITFLIRWVGSFAGAPPAVSVDGSGLVAASGTPSITLATMSSGHIDYDTFEAFDLGLGSGDDLLDVDSTQTGTSGLTTVDAGAGDDVLTVETTSGPTVINGGAGADSISVNAILDPPGTTNGLAGGATRGTTNALTLVGGAGSDTYTVSLWSNGNSRIVVADGTDDGATNVLHVNGTEAADVFLLRSGVVAALNGPVTATSGIQKSFVGAELITYDNLVNAGLAVNGLAGNDVFALDDNSTGTVINGGAGDDSFFVGQMYGDTVHFDAEFEASLTDTTRGQLTNGVSHSTTINGGTGNDLFSILRNRAALQLNGEAGDDTFVIRTFLLETDPTSDAVSEVSTGSGADLVSYVMNAPVAVDGGDGFDTLVLIGTEADDIFVISKDGLWGAGRYVSFVGIEKVDVDGAEGDDLFVVVSTSPTVQTRIFGGLGSDMIVVGAAAPIAVADDLQGHSGIIEHSVESTLGNWTGIPVDGVGAEITDNDTPAVVMTPTGSGTIVREADGAYDIYTVKLARTPSSAVRITVSAPLLSPDDEDARIRTVLVSFDQGATWAASATATFDGSHMEREVWVRAIDDLAEESDRFVVLQHLVVQDGGDREYDGLVLPNAVVRLIDNDRPAVTVIAAAPVRVAEGGATSSYTLDLAKAPAGPVTVRVTAGPQTRVRLDGTTWSTFVDVTFTVANTPVTVYVQGLDDTAVEGSTYDTITHTVLSGGDTGYTPGLVIAPVSVLVDDNDTPVVRIIETDGGTHVVEGGDTDSYQVVLTSNPCVGATGPCSVTVHATAKPTGTRNGTEDTIKNMVQVELSTDNGRTWHTSVDLTFDGISWSTAREVLVRAVDDGFIDGSDYQVFAPTSISRVNQVQGPLWVFGGENPNAAYTIPPPYMLPGESSQALVTTPTPAFDVIEGKQVDTLILDNGNDVAAEAGTLTYDPTAVVDGITGIGTVTGLGMGGDRVIGGKAIAGGVTYGALERLVIHLGKGVDTFTVLSTHAGRTEITGGAGDDVFTVTTIGGATRISGDAGNDAFVVGNAGLLDDLGSLLVLSGGAGNDTATLDDSEERDDQLATVTAGTVTGLDMVGRAGLDLVYSVTVHGTGDFIITVNGLSTGVLAAGITADDLQATLQALLFPGDTCGLPPNTAGNSTPEQNSRCAQSVYVWQEGSTYLIGFTGELGGSVTTLSSTMTDLARPDGVSYDGLEDLTLQLGAGNDGVNVRGTSARTHVNTGGGDDLVFVSDAANLGNLNGVLNAVDLSRLLAALTSAATTRDVEALFAALLHKPLTIDDTTYLGSLDLVAGDLDIDTGAGSNTLAVSDRFDTDPDRGFTVTDSSITGVAPAAITYTSTAGDLAGQGYWTRRADSGLFGHGVSVFLGRGGNGGRIASVRGGALPTSPYGATLTTVWTGEGHDTVTVGTNLPTAGAARLVVHGQHGNDTVVADATATQPLVLFGDEGADTLVGGAGDDLVFGDSGRVYYLRPAGATGYDVVLGGPPVPWHLADPRSGAAATGDTAFTTIDVLRTAATGIGTGDTRLAGGSGNDIVLGGDGADAVLGDDGNDLLFGDYGWVGALTPSTFVDTSLLPLALATHPFAFVSVDTTDANGGGDVMLGGNGADVMLGQQGRDEMWGGTGDDDLIGGHNVGGGNDTGDFIVGGTGNDVVVGDNAIVLRTGSTITTLVRVLVGTRLFLLDQVTGTYYSGNTVGQASANPSGVETRSIRLLDHAIDTSPALYGADTITGEDGDDVIFGELGDDSLNGGNGNDYIEGNGGSDTILGGLGQDDLIGGSSSLFGLSSREMRPDKSDTIYGGDGTQAGRNSAGDGSTAGHANDADVILGDNGNIFKMVRSLNAGFLSFTYDTGSSRVIPRTVVLLDYTPAGDCGKYSLVRTDRATPTLEQGTCTNIGGGDFLHGEGGDDVIHGMTGDDALYGDGQDDDLYGEAGQDWISGGAGQDGIVGDDGLVLTSRNGSTEQLNYLDTATVQGTISGNGPHHNAIINVRGTLLKAVDLEPFYVGWNDVLYGGLGNDFVHGGEGDDAISGGEALAAYYTLDPWATLAQYYKTANLLQFGVRDPEEFLLYNENDPMRLVKVCPIGSTTGCLPFLTTADETGDDGDDALFGDGGNDWMSGGTGVDHLYGGWGHDLLDVDDDKTTTNGSNNKVDGDGNADYAFGGAGRDVLIANSKSDRLIDWIGEFNSYLVPFNQFGASTIWRASAPAVRQFLYDLSRADGADQTRAPANARNGEPYGELGLTSSADAEWGDQHGAPDDPQPGNGGTFSSAAATAAPTGTTAYSGSAGSTTTTTTFAATSTTSTARIASASVAENKKGGTLTVSLAAKATTNVRLQVVVVGLDEVARAVTVMTIWSGATSATGTYALGLVTGGQYELAWMPSTDPAKSDLVLVIRQIA